MNQHEHRFYCLDLANAPKDCDLLMSVLSSTGAFSPKLSVGKDKDLSQRLDYADSLGNIVFIDRKDLKNNSNYLYIELFCDNFECQTEFLVEWITGDKNFVSLQDGLTYSGQIKSQESATFVLKTSSETEEAELTVGFEGSGLEILISNDPRINNTNYLWKETNLSDSNNHSIVLNKSQDLQRNVFYILFYNPTNMSLKYNFTMTRKSLKTIFIEGENHQVNVEMGPHEKSFFLFYSNVLYQMIELETKFSADSKEGENLKESFESALKQGQIIKVRYSKEEETPGQGMEVTFRTSASESYHENNRTILNQTLEITGLPGKYVIEISNPYNFTVRFSILMKTLRPVTQLPGENLQQKKAVKLDWGVSPTYEIFMPRTSGQWYFWFYSCDLPVELTMRSGNSEKDLIRVIPQGGSEMYNETIGNSSISDRFKYVIINPVNSTGRNTVFMYSSLVNESRFWDYEVKEGNLKMSLSYDYQRYNSEVTVVFDPVEFKDPDPTDSVNYYIEICSLAYAPLTAEINICDTLGSNCQISEEEFEVNHNETIRMKVEKVKEGRNFVNIKAFVKHKEQVIRFVPYTVGFVDVRKTFSLNLFVVAIEIIMIVLLCKMYCDKWCQNLWRQCWEKLKRNGKNQRIELQAVGSLGEKKDYNQLEEIEGHSPVPNEGSTNL